MKSLDPKFIDGLSRQAGSCLRAIRLIQSLEENLPSNFPEPDEITTAKKPYDLSVVWHPRSVKHAAIIKNRVNDVLRIDSKWYRPDAEAFGECRACVRVGGKSTMNLHLRINLPCCVDKG